MKKSLAIILLLTVFICAVGCEQGITDLTCDDRPDRLLIFNAYRPNGLEAIEEFSNHNPENEIKLLGRTYRLKETTEKENSYCKGYFTAIFPYEDLTSVFYVCEDEGKTFELCISRCLNYVHMNGIDIKLDININDYVIRKEGSEDIEVSSDELIKAFKEQMGRITDVDLEQYEHCYVDVYYGETAGFTFYNTVNGNMTESLELNYSTRKNAVNILTARNYDRELSAVKTNEELEQALVDEALKRHFYEEDTYEQYLDYERACDIQENCALKAMPCIIKFNGQPYKRYQVVAKKRAKRGTPFYYTNERELYVMIPLELITE